jgi:hypothetical protein
MATNPGIDYGRGITNIDTETGIRYGVINQNEVLQTWADSSLPYYAPYCPYCVEQAAETYEAMVELPECPKCHHKFNPDQSFDNFDPAGFTYDSDGYQCNQSYDDTDIFILKSPYYTYAGFCSPCAPGAGYLMSPFTMSKEMPIDDSLPLGGYAAHAIASGFPKVYCFDHSFFDNGKAPYPVFSVETGELVNP